MLYSCAGTICTSETDKHIKGQRHRYSYNVSKCPTGGKYYNWFFILPSKKAHR